METWLKRGASQAEAAEADAEVRKAVELILADVASRGDAAVRELSGRFDGWDRDDYRLTQAEIDQSHAGMGRFGPEAGTSMLYDRLAGRPLEHEALTGALVEAADRHGIPVPVNRTLLALLSAVSGQKLEEVR